MNKTINVNLGGIFFHIDEDAYDKLQHYLVLLKKSFHGTQGNEEIIADIEARIAELFTERIGDSKQVIGTSDVDFVIQTMGKPEEITEEEENTSQQNHQQNTQDNNQQNQRQSSYQKEDYGKQPKQLFRDDENKVFGGVLAGLAHYIGLDPTLVRIVWALLSLFTWGGFFVIYLFLWIFIPKALTTADKLKMRGKKINVSNIEKTIKDEFDTFNKELNEFGDKLKKADYKSFGSRVKNTSSSAINKGTGILARLFKVFVAVIGIVIILKASMVILATVFSLITGLLMGSVNTFMLEDFAMFNYTSLPFWAFLILAFVIITIPFILLLFVGLKLAFPHKKKRYTPAALTLLALWIFSAILGGYFLAQQLLAFNKENSYTEKIELTIDKAQPISLGYIDNIELEDRMDSRFFDFDIYQNPNGESQLVSNDVDLYIKHTDNEFPYLKIKRTANDANAERAYQLAKDIEIDYQFTGNDFNISPHLLTDIKDKFHGQQVDFILYLPTGYKYYVEENFTRKIGFRVRYQNEYYDYDYHALDGNRKIWEMKPNGVFCTNCKKMSNSDELEKQIENHKNDAHETEPNDVKSDPKTTVNESVSTDKKTDKKVTINPKFKKKIGKTTSTIQKEDYDF
jgi:phage shock protein PspC (stress-responsive transcriptional regulator)